MAAEKTEPKKSRLFFALWPDPEVLKALNHTRKTLGVNEGKPVNPEKYHVTLLFLGEIPEDQIPALKSLAEKAPFEPCELVLDQMEHWVRPAVLCLVATQTPPALDKLVEAMKRELRKMGIKTEKRPFRPHLTLARKVRKRVVGRPVEPIHWPIHDFVLVASGLNREGSRYRILGRWPETAQ